jgi:parallel beta-helix repeat protein
MRFQSKSLNVLILVILSTLGFIAILPFGLAQSGTSVSGIIGSDSTWVSTGSPFNLIGNILVSNGVTLTVGSGSTINLNGFYIMVNGSLVIQQGVTINMATANAYILVNGAFSAVGTSTNPIQINGNMGGITSFGPVYYSRITFSTSSIGWNQATNSGSIIENAVVNMTEIDVGSSVKMHSDTFVGGEISVTGGSPLIYESYISNLVYIKGGSCSLTNNQIIGGFILYSGGDTTTITNNIISHSQSVSGVRDGIWFSGDQGNNLLIQNNLITDNTYGIQIFSPNVDNIPTTSIIKNNTITNNTVGIYVSNSYVPTIVNNNIENNTFSIKLVSDYSGHSRGFDVSNNWWGSIDLQTINASIYDFKNDFNLGIVTFVPILTARNPQATLNLVYSPTLSPTPTASPTSASTQAPTSNPTSQPPNTNNSNSQLPSPTPSTPEFPAIAILPLFVVIFSIAIILRKKSMKSKDFR